MQRLAQSLEMALRKSIAMEFNTFEKITSEQFVDRIVVSEADALVKISSAWSGADQMLSHTLQELAAKYSGKLNFFSIDRELDAALCLIYRVDTVPTLLFFKKGALVDKLSGLTNRNVIANKMDQLLIT